MLIGISNALVVLFFIFVFFGVRGRIAALPEGFDKVVALFIVRELPEGGALFVGDDVNDVFVEPLLVRLAQFLLESLLILLALLVVSGAFERIDCIRGLGLSCASSILGSRSSILSRLVGRFLVRLVLGKSDANQQTEKCEQNTNYSLIRRNPEHERDSCQDDRLLILGLSVL